MKSTLRNMVLVLLTITLVASAAVGYVYKITKDPIQKAKDEKTLNALAVVLPRFDNEPSADRTEVEIDGANLIVYKGTLGGKITGYAVETVSSIGYSGDIKLLVGFTPEGDIENIQVLEQSETPGLGSKMTEEGNALIVSFEGKNPADLKMAVVNDGGDINSLTASTISSRAYVQAVDRAYRAYLQIK